MQKRIQKTHTLIYPNFFTYPALAIFGVFFCVPTLAAFVLGFTDWDITRLFTPSFNGVANFLYLFQDEHFLLALQNTFVFAFLAVIGKMFFGLLLALILNTNLRTRNFLRTVFYLPAVLSMVVVGIIFSALLRMDGMVNHILAFLGLNSRLDWLGNPQTALFCTIVAEVWKWSGFTMAIFLAGLQTIPEDYYEAAKIDGASPFRQLLYITLPLLAPAFTIALTMNLIGSLKVFEQVYVMTAGGPGFASQVLGTYIFQSFSLGNLGRSTAMGLVQFMIISVIALVFARAMKRREVEL